MTTKTNGGITDAAIAQAFAWYTDDFRTDRSATTYDPEVAQRWRDKGWPVWELFATPPAQDAEAVQRLQEDAHAWEDCANFHKERADALQAALTKIEAQLRAAIAAMRAGEG